MISKDEQVSGRNLQSNGQTPSEKTVQWDGQKRRWRNSGAPRQGPRKLAGEMPFINQVMHSQGSSPPDLNCRSKQREDGQPFRPIILLRDPRHNRIFPLIRLHSSSRPWIKNKDSQKLATGCLSRSQNYKVLANVETQLGVLTRKLSFFDTGAGLNFAQTCPSCLIDQI